MVRPLSEIIRDTDEILARRTAGGEKIASSSDQEMSDDDIFKLAAQIRKAPEVHVEKRAQESSDDLEFTMREKVAHAIAIVDTLLNLPTLAKVAAFEDAARAEGYTTAQIAAQLEKTAGIQFRSILNEMPWLLPES